MSGRRRTYLSKIVLIAFSAALSAALSAVALEFYETYRYDRWHATFRKDGDWYNRLTVASDDPILLWEYRPNFAAAESNLTTNMFGFRQPNDVTLAKPPGVFRVAFIGDSVTLGLGVDSDDVFVSQFEKIMRDTYHRKNVEALNFGIDGYNTAQVEELLKRKVLKFSPDLIVYSMCLNDFEGEESSGGKSDFFRRPRSFLLRDIRKIETRIFHHGQDFHEYGFEINKGSVFQSVYRMKRLADRKSIPYLVVILPVFRHATVDFLRGHETRTFESFSAYPIAGLHKSISDELGKSDVTVVDMLPVFETRREPPTAFSLDAWHPNAAGHRIIARGIAEGIMSRAARLMPGCAAANGNSAPADCLLADRRSRTGDRP